MALGDGEAVTTMFAATELDRSNQKRQNLFRVLFLTMTVLRFIKAGKSTATSPVLTPKRSAWSVCSYTVALSSSTLVGMHPRQRQVPPRTESFSTIAVLSPI